jgi:hypothetical protein
MRTVLDEHGVPATIFDEHTHPLGKFYQGKGVAPAPVKVEPDKKLNLDLNGDGKVDKKDTALFGKGLQMLTKRKK